ncbi:hypothetical protein ABEX78_23325 [Priestia megaterium]
MTLETTIVTSLVGEKNDKLQQKFKEKGIPTLLSEAEFKFKE